MLQALPWAIAGVLAITLIVFASRAIALGTRPHAQPAPTAAQIAAAVLAAQQAGAPPQGAPVQQPPVQQPPQQNPAPTRNWWGIFKKIFLILLAITMVVVLGLATWSLFKYLSAPPTTPVTPSPPPQGTGNWYDWIVNIYTQIVAFFAPVTNFFTSGQWVTPFVIVGLSILGALLVWQLGKLVKANATKMWPFILWLVIIAFAVGIIFLAAPAILEFVSSKWPNQQWWVNFMGTPSFWATIGLTLIGIGVLVVIFNKGKGGVRPILLGLAVLVFLATPVGAGLWNGLVSYGHGDTTYDTPSTDLRVGVWSPKIELGTCSVRFPKGEYEWFRIQYRLEGDAWSNHPKDSTKDMNEFRYMILKSGVKDVPYTPVC